MAILYYGAWLYLRVSVDLTAEGSAATLALAPAPVRRSSSMIASTTLLLSTLGTKLPTYLGWRVARAP
eukprot:scaffold96639_cov51-Phaeocystis_antarctica.AAC.1